ncbi:hypothetical protein ACTI_78420 [Actinoplanes sp. OR16]|nr:hypothetical protein ACTI_78420 [Actinoplanes sp. OR16]
MLVACGSQDPVRAPGSRGKALGHATIASTADEGDRVSESVTYGNCVICGEELRHGDWVIRAEEMRKLGCGS